MKDSKANIGAVLHINPDDDPIAGETSQLYFDLQDRNSRVRLPYPAYELIITDEKGVERKPLLSISDSTLIANHTFHAQGLYKLTLRSKPSYDQFLKVSMEDSLRVSRGIESTAKASPAHPLASMIAFGAGIAFMVLVILAFNNRRIIARHSTF